MQPSSLLFLGVGLILVFAAICDWDLLMNGARVRRMVEQIGRGAARALYAAIGAVLVVIGGLQLMGILQVGARGS